MDDQKPRAQAMAVKVGRIMAVGDNDEIGALADSKTERVNLNGHLAIPGLMDSHFHFYDWALGRRQLDLARVTSIEDLLAMLWVKILLVAIVSQISLYFNDLYEFKTGDNMIEMSTRLVQSIGMTSIALAAIYFLNTARFTMLQTELLSPSKPQTLCHQLKEILEAVETNESRAQATRYAASYNRLRLDVSGAKQTVPGCN